MQAWYEYVPNPALWADVVLVVHAGIIVFVIGLLAGTLIGGPRGWSWIRSPWLRWPHLGVVLVVVVQSARGRYCPLTYWEDDLRRVAGQSVYDSSFIDYWVSQLVYPDFPDWGFSIGYSIFAVLVAFIWFKWPPRTQPTKH